MFGKSNLPWNQQDHTTYHIPVDGRNRAIQLKHVSNPVNNCEITGYLSWESKGTPPNPTPPKK